MTDIIIAHGICSPIRPKVATALGPYGVQYNAECWAQDEDGTHRRTDGDSMAALHVAQITVSPQAAVWAEYLLCRYMTANPGVGMRLLSTPLDKRNQRWAARHDRLPRAWRQEGCKTQLPQAASTARKARTPSTRRSPGRGDPGPARLGLLGRLLRRR